LTDFVGAYSHLLGNMTFFSTDHYLLPQSIFQSISLKRRPFRIYLKPSLWE